jgi:hypothetical protein
MKKLRTIPMRRAITAFLCGLMVFYTVACTYYRTAVREPKYIPALAAKQMSKTMFLHMGENIYLIKSLEIKDNQTAIIEIDTLSSRMPFYNPAHKYGKVNKTNSSILREVHLYLSSFSNVDFEHGKTEVPIAAFSEVDVVTQDLAVSVVIGVLVGSVVIGVVTLAAAFNSSCPYIYVYDGENYLFQGEIFSGATFPNMERHDYLPLPQLQPVKGEYQLRIANELQENQFVNMAQLQAIRHPECTQALVDVHGAPQLIAAPQRPLSATSALGNDASALTAQKDGLAFLFDEERAEKNSLTLQFENQPGATHPKLVLHAANSLWVDQLFGRYLEKWGDAYPQWSARQAAMSYEQRQEQNIRQDFYLSAFVKDAGGQWQLAGRFPLAGPMARRDMVLPLDPALLHGDKVDVRLETAYRFWDVDYAAMDFSDNTGMEVVSIPANSAKDQSGKSQLKVLAGDDDLYLRQLRTGDFTDLRFKALSPSPGQTQTFFLHTKGYYEYVRNYSGEPQMDELEHFRKPHYFDQFSKEEYRRAPMVIRFESD